MNTIFEFCLGIKHRKFQMKKIELDIKNLEHAITENFIPILEEAYEKSPPKLGDLMMFIDFKDKYAFPVVVTDINGNNLRAKESKTCYHSFSLKMDPDKYYTSTFVIPMEMFNTMQEQFKFNVLESRVYG